MSNITQADLDAINSFPISAYYNGKFLGILNEGEHTISLPREKNEFGTSQTGPGGIIGSAFGGVHAIVTLTMRNVNKDNIRNLLYNVYEIDTHSTDINSPNVGRIRATSYPRIEFGKPLVIYPHAFDRQANKRYGDSTDNPLAIVLPHAEVTNDLEIPMSSGSQTDIEVEFRGNVDPTNNNTTLIWGKGIDTDGTITS